MISVHCTVSLGSVFSALSPQASPLTSFKGADHGEKNLSWFGSEWWIAAKIDLWLFFSLLIGLYETLGIISCWQSQQGPSFVLMVLASLSSGQYRLCVDQCDKSSTGQAYVKDSDKLWWNERRSIFFCAVRINSTYIQHCQADEKWIIIIMQH